MPFIKDVDRFDATIDALRNSDHVTKEQLDYLDLKLEKKDKWALCYIKKAFAGGICTSSRVEGLHAVQKKYLTSSSSLKKVFESFKKLEKTQLAKFKEEFKLRSSGEVDDILSLKFLKRIILNIYTIEFTPNIKLESTTLKRILLILISGIYFLFFSLFSFIQLLKNSLFIIE